MTALLLAAVAAAACIAAGFCAPPLTERTSPPRPHDAAGSAALALYANVWAVRVEGGREEADTLAKKYNFINKGQVRALSRICMHAKRIILHAYSYGIVSCS